MASNNNEDKKSTGSESKKATGSSSIAPVPTLGKKPDVNSCGSMPAEEDCKPPAPKKKPKSKEGGKNQGKGKCSGTSQKRKASPKKKKCGNSPSPKGQKRKASSSGTSTAKRPKCGKNSMVVAAPRPPNAFLLFFHERLRNEGRGMRVTEVAYDASVRWRDMSYTQQGKYYNRYDALCKKCKSLQKKNKKN